MTTRLHTAILSALIALAALPFSVAVAQPGVSPAAKSAGSVGASAAREASMAVGAAAVRRFEGTVNVRVRMPSDFASVRASAIAAGGVVLKTYGRKTLTVRPPAWESADSFSRELETIQGVRFASPTVIVSAVGVPDDPDYPAQWGLPKIGAPTAWDYASGSGVVVAVIDTGVDHTHPDLDANVVQGYNVVAPGQPTMDVYGHGTHVAGIVAAETDNGIYGAGTAPGATILAVKTLTDAGEGTDQDTADGIEWAADNGADIISMSIGTGDYSTPLATACAYARSKGCLLVAASGNTGDAAPFYPAGNIGVVGVAALTSTDARASFSAYGPGIVDISAPGSTIYSTVPLAYNAADMAYKSGTSMATPFVSGVAALLWQADPSLTADEVAQRLQQTAVDVGGVAGYDQYTGWGRVDAANMIATVQPDTYEPDDSVAAAEAATRSIAHAAAYTHTTYPPGDIDVRYSQLVSGRTYRFSTSSLVGTVDTHLYLHSTDGTTVLGHNDDSSGSTRASSVVHTATASGRHYIRNVPTGSGLGLYTMGMTDITASRHVRRISDDDRYSVAYRVALAGYPSLAGVDDVVVACGEDRAAADALSASGLCAIYDAPLLITPSATLASEVRTVLNSAPASVTVHIVGGTGSVSSAVADQMSAIGNVEAVERTAGADRFAVAANVAREVDAATGGTNTIALVANGADSTKFFDALALSAVSAHNSVPILLVSATSVPSATRNALDDLGLTRVYVGGGPGTVDGGVYSSLGADARWYGATRYDTAVDVANEAIALGLLHTTYAGVAAKLPDALTGGSYMGAIHGGPILVTAGASLSSQVGTYLDTRQSTLDGTDAFGGTGSLSTSTYNSIVSRLAY